MLSTLRRTSRVDDCRGRNIERQIVDRLRADGHEVLYIAESAPAIDDRTVLSRSESTNAILLTSDKDFGDLVFRQHLVHAGVLLIRLAGLAPAVKAGLVAGAFNHHGDELRAGFAVLSERSLRVRKPLG